VLLARLGSNVAAPTVAVLVMFLPVVVTLTTNDRLSVAFRLSVDTEQLSVPVELIGSGVHVHGPGNIAKRDTSPAHFRAFGDGYYPKRYQCLPCLVTNSRIVVVFSYASQSLDDNGRSVRVLPKQGYCIASHITNGVAGSSLY